MTKTREIVEEIRAKDRKKQKEKDKEADEGARMQHLVPGKIYKIHTDVEPKVANEKLPIFRSVDHKHWLYKDDVVMLIETDDMFAKFLRVDQAIVCLASILWQKDIEFKELV